MKLEKFLSEITSHQKSFENPRVINGNGGAVIATEYHSEENAIVLYFEEEVVVPTLALPTGGEMPVFGLEI